MSICHKCINAIAIDMTELNGRPVSLSTMENIRPNRMLWATADWDVVNACATTIAHMNIKSVLDDNWINISYSGNIQGTKLLFQTLAIHVGVWRTCRWMATLSQWVAHSLMETYRWQHETCPRLGCVFFNTAHIMLRSRQLSVLSQEVLSTW